MIDRNDGLARIPRRAVLRRAAFHHRACDRVDVMPGVPYGDGEESNRHRGDEQPPQHRLPR